MQQPEIMDIEHGEIQDLVAIIDGLWDTWPSTEDDLTNEINNHAFAPHPNSPLQRKLTTLNRLTQSLCLDDQFLARLYKLGIPPANLTVDNNRLQGTPSSTNETIILRHAEATHIPAKTKSPRTLSLIHI